MTTCSSIEPWLPLYAGGDLDPVKMEKVEAHLAACIGCARTALELEDARIWLRSAEVPEFDDETLLQLRHAIRRKVDNERREIDRWAWLRMCLRPAVLATTAVLLAAALAFFWWSRRPGELAKHETPPQNVEVEKHSHGETGGNVANLNTQLRRRNHRLSRRTQLPQVELPSGDRQIVEALPRDVNQADSPMVRLEIQTADPNIRIIWLTPAEAPVRTESMEEFK
jgi:hypothetical protein